MYIGKEVGYTQAWVESEGSDIMREVLKAKSDQVSSFQELVAKHSSKTFVEATWDKVWGIGLPFTSDSLQNMNAWEGQNLLGKLIGKL